MSRHCATGACSRFVHRHECDWTEAEIVSAYVAVATMFVVFPEKAEQE